jgi:hypothetical protein
MGGPLEKTAGSAMFYSSAPDALLQSKHNHAVLHA